MKIVRLYGAVPLRSTVLHSEYSKDFWKAETRHVVHHMDLVRRLKLEVAEYDLNACLGIILLGRRLRSICPNPHLGF